MPVTKAAKDKRDAQLRSIIKMCEVLLELEPESELECKLIETATRGIAQVALGQAIDLIGMIRGDRKPGGKRRVATCPDRDSIADMIARCCEPGIDVDRVARMARGETLGFTFGEIERTAAGEWILWATVPAPVEQS
jgi:hypothetical protein